MTHEELNKVLGKHKKWLNDEEGGENADLRNADLSGANLDFSAFPLWCGGLDVHIDDRLAIQLLYHLVRNVKFSKNVSKELKALLLTGEIVSKANEFHRVRECGKIESPKLEKGGKTK